MGERLHSCYHGDPDQLITLDKVLEVERWIAKDSPTANLIRGYDFERKDINSSSEPLIYSCQLVYSPIDGSMRIDMQFPVKAYNQTMAKDEVTVQCEELHILLREVLGVTFQNDEFDEILKKAMVDFTSMRDRATQQAKSSQDALNMRLSVLENDLRELADCRRQQYDLVKLVGWFGEGYKGPWKDLCASGKIMQHIHDGLILPATFFYTDVTFDATLPSSSGNLIINGKYSLERKFLLRDTNAWLQVGIDFTHDGKVDIIPSLATYETKGFFPQSVRWLLPYPNTLELQSEMRHLVDASVEYGNTSDVISVSAPARQRDLWERLTHIFQVTYSMEMRKQSY